MPEKWKRSIFISRFKNKGDVQICNKYRGTLVMRQSMQMWERLAETRLRREVKIWQQQYGLMPGKGATDTLFDLSECLKRKSMVIAKKSSIVFSLIRRKHMMEYQKKNNFMVPMDRVVNNREICERGALYGRRQCDKNYKNSGIVKLF